MQDVPYLLKGEAMQRSDATPAYDLIIERGGSIVVETIEACDEDAAWRAGLMLHIEALMAVVCRDEHDPESTRS